VTEQLKRVRWPLAIAFLAGGSTMAVEIAAVRLLSPWFGTSLVVWTNVLEVILLGLALGYLAGAKLSVGDHPGKRLTAVLFAGALFTAWAPLLAAPICEWFLPSGLALQQAAPLLTWGSLAACLVLFLPSACILGMVGPLLVELICRGGEKHAGSAGGQVLAASTLGSVLGAFATSYFALSHPLLGVSRTFVLVGVLLAACAIWSAVALRNSSKTSALAILPLLVLPAFFFGRLRLPELSEGVTQLAKLESVYQTVRAVEDSRFEVSYRYLQVNEGFDSYQSVWTEQLGLLGEGFYYDDFVLPLWLSQQKSQWDLLVLGFGAGTVQRVLIGAKPENTKLVTTGVELDADVVRMGHEWFSLPENNAGLTVFGGLDARFALRSLPGPFDQIVLDAYANQVEIPPHLSTVEFFDAVRERLAPGGWAVANVGGFGFDDPVVLNIALTLAASFDRDVLVLRVPSTRNFTLLARRDAEVPAPGSDEWSSASTNPIVERLFLSRDLPGGWQVVRPPSEAPLTDDRNPIERLQLQSLREGGARLHAGT
jgi:spermidine synthase